MSIDAQWQLEGWVQLAISLLLPVVLFVVMARWLRVLPPFIRFLSAIIVPWFLLVLFRGLFAASIEEAHFYAHYCEPDNFDDLHVYNDQAANLFTLFLGWVLPFVACLATQSVVWVARFIRARRLSTSTVA